MFSIEKVWSVALTNGANVLALNVIETALSKPPMTKKRDDLNQMIMSHHEPGL